MNKLEPVRFKRWVPRRMENVNNFQSPVDGTGKFEDEFKNEGFFIGFGVDYEEFEDGIGNYTVALVRLSSGAVENVLPENLMFEEVI